MIANDAALSAANAQPAASNTVSNTVIWPELQLHKVVEPAGEVLPGTTLTYTLRYTNPSGMVLTNVVISDDLDQASFRTMEDPSFAIGSAAGRRDPAP